MVSVATPFTPDFELDLAALRHNILGDLIGTACHHGRRRSIRDTVLCNHYAPPALLFVRRNLVIHSPQAYGTTDLVLASFLHIATHARIFDPLISGLWNLNRVSGEAQRSPEDGARVITSQMRFCR